MSGDISSQAVEPGHSKGSWIQVLMRPTLMTNLPVTGTHEMRPHEKNPQQTIGHKTTAHETSPREMRPQVTSALETSPHETTHDESS